LEYYFSTADNDRYGCGSKVTHNVTGHFGVMDGSASDLRTGLPRQMIEIHEAMRLLVVVEHSTEVLTAIYQRQPAIEELVGNGWVQLAAMDPESGAIQLFRPGVGWVPWQMPEMTLPKVGRSAQCYAGESGPCPPALIATPDEVSAHA
ncbi:MAG: putative inorganic carbon transporter subunit DabA, partial [Pseudomonadota bacterium]|nr:putative inorganic carbon transporter subunit DabA [Pseudomonadota bacterium]